jgi:hypothetical protein
LSVSLCAFRAPHPTGASILPPEVKLSTTKDPESK